MRCAATADGIYAAIAAAGGAAVAGLVRPVAGPLRWLAAVVLVGLAARTAVTAWRRRDTPVLRDGLGTPGRAYLGLLALTLLNPATVIYFSALVLGRQAQFARSVSAATSTYSETSAARNICPDASTPAVAVGACVVRSFVSATRTLSMTMPAGS